MKFRQKRDKLLISNGGIVDATKSYVWSLRDIDGLL